MGNLIEHAKRELEIAGAFDKDSMYGGMLGGAVIELVEKFSEQGHSGYSAGMVIQMFSKVADFKPLMGIQNTDDEWNYTYGHFQNNRCSAIFKKEKGSNPYYIDSIIFREDDGSCFSGSAELSDGSKIKSGNYIKKFPFTPKTFYIDVISKRYDKDKETGELTETPDGDWWEHWIKDESQLGEVWEIYNRK